MNNVCSSSTSQHKNNYITNNDSLRLKLKVNIHHINTIGTKLVTVVISSKIEHQRDNNSRQQNIISINNQLPSSLLPHPVINTITVSPNIWRKKLSQSINTSSTTM